MKNKKGFFGLIPILILIALIVFLIFAIIYRTQIAAIITFFSHNWWVLILGLCLIFFLPQIRAILNMILSKFGVKI